MIKKISFNATREHREALDAIQEYLRRNSPPEVTVTRSWALWYAIETTATRIRQEEARDAAHLPA